MDLKDREKQLREAHKKISEEIEALLDQRIKIVGALEENLYMQKKSQEVAKPEKGETPPAKKEMGDGESK